MFAGNRSVGLREIERHIYASMRYHRYLSSRGMGAVDVRVIFIIPRQLKLTMKLQRSLDERIFLNVSNIYILLFLATVNIRVKGFKNIF